MYLYRTTLFKSTTNVLNPPATNDADRIDFETNYKATAIAVSEVVIAETTFITDLSYANFKAKILSPILWSDVKYLDDAIKYVLNLTSNTPL